MTGVCTNAMIMTCMLGNVNDLEQGKPEVVNGLEDFTRLHRQRVSPTHPIN